VSDDHPSESPPAPSAGAVSPTLPDLPERLVVDWEGELRYKGGREGVPPVTIDGRKQAGPGAVDSVVLGLVACVSQDVIEILNKRRTPAESLSVEVRYARANAVPRVLSHIHLIYRVRTASEVHHIENAVKLVVEKYCSVASSLKDDIEITSEVHVEKP
jgi:putative redox protein